MAAESSSASGLPWVWAIEYLSSCKKIDTSLLNALIKRIPDFADPSGKNARERVSLRCLEDLFGPSKSRAIPYARGSKIRFDLSGQCEDVFQHIVRKMPASNLRRAGPELSKWDVHPFIMHKRTCLPKCALQQLKDTVVEGSLPSAPFFKERIRLLRGDRCDIGISGDDGDPNATVQKRDGSGMNVQMTVETGNLNLPIPENGNELLPEYTPNRNLLPSKRDRTDLVSENPVGQYHENQTGMNNGGDLHSNAKKLRQDSSCIDISAGRNELPPSGNGLLEDSSGRIVQCSVGEGFDSAEEFQAGFLEQSRFSVEGHDKHDASRRLGKNGDVDDSDSRYNQPLPLCFNDKMPQDTSGDGPYQDISADEAKDDDEPSGRTQQKTSGDQARDDSEHNFQLKTLNGEPLGGSCENNFAEKAKDDFDHRSERGMLCESNEYCDREIDIAMKKHSFLSSQSAFNHDSLETTDLMELNLCMKCNEGGQLLLCSSSACPLVVHENCLGSSASFDDQGNFYCPFCAYSRAILEYLEAKKKASLARKELAAFIGLRVDHQREKPSKRLHKKEQNEKRKDGHVEESNLANDADLANTVNPQHGSIEDKQQADGHLEESNLANAGDHVNTVNPPHGSIEDKQPADGHVEENNLANDQDHVNIVNSRHGSVEDKQQAEPLAPCVNENLCCGGDATVMSGTLYVVTEGKGGGENMIQERESGSELNGLQNEVRVDPNCNVDNQRHAEVAIQQEVSQHHITYPPHDPTSPLNIDAEETLQEENDKCIASRYSMRRRRQESQRHAEVAIQQEVLQHHVIDPPRDPASPLNIGAEETLEEENDKSIASRYSMRHRRQEMHYTYPAIPQLRRKKVPWTAVEEEKLKEGVRRFSCADDTSIPWTKILEFGDSVFKTGRTAMDLKDKWRNICKTSQKSK